MLIINGQRIPVPGCTGTNFLDNPKLGFTNKSDYRLRQTSWVRSICVHTRMGVWPQKFTHSNTDRHWDELGVKRASEDDRIASWHISIDSDGSYVCHLDLAKHCAYHCGQVNDVSIGIEMYQEADGTVTEETLVTCMNVIGVITRELKIQRQFVAERGLCKRLARSRKPNPSKPGEVLSYMPGGGDGLDFVGIFGHRNATKNRGLGDPGDKIFEYLEQIGYEKFRIDSGEDLDAWKVRQRDIAMLAPHDGIPGPGTVRTLAKKQSQGEDMGLWVRYSEDLSETI